MRSDSAAFAALNVAPSKAPRFVVRIQFAASSLYLSSHAGISGVPSTHLEACLVEPSIASQKLNPDAARAEIGAASFTVADRGSAFTAAVQTRLAAGEGLRDKTVEFYLGFESLAWSSFVLVGTQIIKSAAFERGAYRIACNDIQRATRKDVFDPATTTIAATVEPTDTTINVVSTAGFSTVFHGTSYSDAPSATVGYLKIKEEIIRYTGKTSTSFTGCTRGAMGTTAGRYVADGATPAARREKVSEYIYLELPAPKLAYALLTGTLYGDSASLPSTWHLGIASGLIRQADFTGVGADLWDTTSDSRGMILRFEGLTKTDGKLFIETEILRALGLYMPVYATGQLGLRRMTRVLADASTVLTLDETNCVAVGDLEHDMESMHNVFSVLWNWNGRDYTRTTTYVDATSAAKHGRAPVLELKFKGLYGGRHTDGVIFKLLDSIRDRYSAPPVRIDVEALHRVNPIEVGDVVRLRLPSVRDFNVGDASIDRAFEVQSVAVNHRTGAVSLELFGSTSRATIDTPTQPTTALPDAFYTAVGTNLASVWTISGGVVSGGPYTLAGGADITASGSVWYYDGDLTIPSTVTINVTGNVQLRVRGYLTIDGTINGVGGGHAGVADNSSATTVIAGNPGYVGSSHGTDGISVASIGYQSATVQTKAPLGTFAANPSVPYFALEVDGNNLRGLPTDLRGTGGGPGGKVVYGGTLWAGGGQGANGGAGLCTITRGLGIGASGSINLSGANSAAPSSYLHTALGPKGISRSVRFFPGAGGAGGPGSYLLLIDGGLLSVPDLAGKFTARTGTVGVPAANYALQDDTLQQLQNVDQPFAGWLGRPDVISGLDLSFSAQRIQYIPAAETATTDTETIPPPKDVTITSGSSGFTIAFAAGDATPVGTVFEVWQHSSATPFSSATKITEGAVTSFFIPRNNTTTVYVWVRARYRNDAGVTIWSSTAPAADGLPAAAAATAGTYATASPTSIAGSAANSSITTGTVTASLVGGSPSTFSWVRQSGSTAISANSASAAATTFSATGVAAGATVNAVFRCTIDGTYTVDVAVSCTNTTSTLSASVSPSSVSKTEDAATITTASVTVTPSGGAGGNTFSWAKISGGSISAVSPSAATTTFQATTMAAAESRSATFRCTVTDSASATATVDVSVTVTRAGVTVSISPTSLYKYGATPGLTTSSCTASASGGVPGYTYAWTLPAGGTTGINSPSSATTTFSVSGMLPGEVRILSFRCTATDSTSGTPLTGYQDIVVTFEREPAPEP